MLSVPPSRSIPTVIQIHPQSVPVPSIRRAAALAVGPLLCLSAFAQEPVADAGQDDARLDKLEAEQAELERRIDLVAEDVEGLRLGEVLTTLGEGYQGMGPAASKVYGLDQGLTIGGYGEVFARFDDEGTDTADALRGVFYFGYRFDEKWLLNTEIELEHAD